MASFENFLLLIVCIFFKYKQLFPVVGKINQKQFQLFLLVLLFWDRSTMQCSLHNRLVQELLLLLLLSGMEKSGNFWEKFLIYLWWLARKDVTKRSSIQAMPRSWTIQWNLDLCIIHSTAYTSYVIIIKHTSVQFIYRLTRFPISKIQKLSLWIPKSPETFPVLLQWFVRKQLNNHNFKLRCSHL